MQSVTEGKKTNGDAVECLVRTAHPTLDAATDNAKVIDGDEGAHPVAQVSGAAEDDRGEDVVPVGRRVIKKRVHILSQQLFAPAQCNSEKGVLEKPPQLDIDSIKLSSTISPTTLGATTLQRLSLEASPADVWTNGVNFLENNAASDDRAPAKTLGPSVAHEDDVLAQTAKWTGVCAESAPTAPEDDEQDGVHVQDERFAGSPVRHRRKRLVSPHSELGDGFTGGKPQLWLPAVLIQSAEASGNLTTPMPSSFVNSDSNGAIARLAGVSIVFEKKADVVIEGRDVLSSVGSLPDELSPSPTSRAQLLRMTNALRGRRDSSDTLFMMKTPSPVPVTLAGAGRFLRQKHLKRVSCYILGPLLGEGVFGVVRDAIDTLGNRTIPPCFQRVAIKSYKHRNTEDTANTPQMARATATMTKKTISVEATPTPPAASDVKPPIPLSRQRRDARMQRSLENEVRNLQRFHCPNIIRGIDVFTRHGKDYVVFPIAVCNVEQLVHETLRREFRHRALLSKGRRQSFAQYSVGSTRHDGTPSSELVVETSMVSCLSFGDESSQRNLGMMDRTSSLLPATLVRSIMFQLLHGVAYLHQQGLAHNDLKPQNILLFVDGVLKITDLGSVAVEYNDQGTPMYVSPEVCRYFYGAEDLEGAKETSPVDALKNDMWSCGVILYYLLMGRPLWECGLDLRNKYQLYREIAAQHTPIDLSHVPEPDENLISVKGKLERGFAAQETDSSKTFPSRSLRHLLSRLLDVNPATRLNAQEALQHPCMQLLRADGHTCSDVIGLVQQDVSRMVQQSPHLKALIRRDREQHLQFVAECCHVLGVAMPEEIFLPNPNTSISEKEPFFNGLDTWRESRSAVPVGTVNRALFPSEEECRYYEKKLGKAEYDVRFILTNPVKVKMMEEYLLHTVLVECGYRTAEEANAERTRELVKNQQKIIDAENRVARGSSSASRSSAAGNGKKGRPGKQGGKNEPCSGCVCDVM